MEFEKITIDDNFCYPEYPVIDNEQLIISLRFSTPEAHEDLCIYSEIRSINLSNKSTDWIYKLPEDKNEVKTKPVVSSDKIFVCTKQYVVALNKSKGTVLWQFNTELHQPGITIIDNTLFLTEQNQLILLNTETGKKIKLKKYRVGWLCKSVVEYNKRLFVSTSNYKIIEIDRNSLDIINEFKLTGKWSVGILPLLYDNKMFANSYTSYAVCFDLKTNETLWRVKKNAGSEPKHLLVPDSDLYCVIEAFNPTKITACSLEKGKKKWAKDYHIHCLADFNDNNMIGLMRNQDGNYQVNIIRKDNGEIEKVLLLTGYQFDNRFEYRLWEGAEIAINENIIAIVYSPNEIFFKTIRQGH